MESTIGNHDQEDKTELRQWLCQYLSEPFISFTAMPYDASLRRYYRVQTRTSSLVVMDASLSKECLRPFIAIADALRSHGLNTPNIMAHALESGFLLITDFGEATYLKSLNDHNASLLYQSALLALLKMQSCSMPTHYVLPEFDANWIEQEWAWHQEWFLGKWLGMTSLPATLNNLSAVLIQVIMEQPRVFMHRDYHSANLMSLSPHQHPSEQCVGILDFQDAFIGPLTYDLASLLRDCYINWSEERVHDWLNFYCAKLNEHSFIPSVDQRTLVRWFDFMSVERHLKALFTFARKCVRDQEPRYLMHVPRTLHYLSQVSGVYSELKPLHRFIVDILPSYLSQKGITLI